MAKNSEPFRILVATAKTPAFTQEQANIVEQSLSDLKKFSDRRFVAGGRQTQLVWRVSKELATAIEVDNSLDDLTGEGLASQLENVDAVISTASTLMIEAMLFDLPVALLDYHNTPAYLKTAWRIGCCDHIQSTIEKMVARPEQKMLFQRTELEDATYCRTDATERMAALIRGMQETASQQVQAGQPLSFPPNLLPAIKDISSDRLRFDHAKIFSNFDEFSINDRSELQSQLAHSRREISHLQHRLTIRESELAQAHQIFDKVNSHPIAGPLIKLGRWWQGLGQPNDDEKLNQL